MVKPRISVASACCAASSVRYDGSDVISTGCGVAAMKACQCASISPGISTRPPPSITATCPASTSIGSTEIRSIRLPITSTSEAGLSVGLVPSKTRTSRNSVASDVGATGGGVPGTSMSKSCAAAGDAATSASSSPARSATDPRSSGMCTPIVLPEKPGAYARPHAAATREPGPPAPICSYGKTTEKLRENYSRCRRPEPPAGPHDRCERVDSPVRNPCLPVNPPAPPPAARSSPPPRRCAR